jgi:hypothetical protein
MNKEEFKKQICGIIDKMDEDECENLSLKLTSSNEKQDIAQELIKINGEFKKLTKTIQILNEKDKQNINDIKPYIQLYKFLKDSQDILFSMPNVNYINLLKFNMHFGSFKVAYMDMNQLFMDIMNDISLKPMVKYGDKFDPQYHEIVETINDDTIEDEIVVDIIEQGFKHKNILINYAKVKVNKKL